MDKRWLRCAALIAGAALLILLRGMLGRIALLLLAAATMAYLMYPVEAYYVKKLRCGEGLGTVLSFATAVLGLSVLLGIGIPAIVRQTEALGRSAPQLMEGWLKALEGLLGRLRALGLSEGVLDAVQAQAGEYVGKGAAYMMGKLTVVVGAVTSRGFLVFSPVLAFYMLRDRQRLFAFLTRAVPAKYRKSVLIVAHSVRDAMAAYVGGQVTVSAVTGGLTALGLLAIGVDSWLLLGAVMLLCNLIPYFGPWLGAIPVVLFAASDGIWKVLGGLAVVLMAQQVEGLFVSPRIIGDAASLHPALVILSLMAGGWLAGLPGMFYAIPAVLCLRAAVNALRDARVKN